MEIRNLILTFSMLLLCSVAFGNSGDDNENDIIVEITMIDGEVCTEYLCIEDFKQFKETINVKYSEWASCTIISSSGECKTRRRTCDEAEQPFADCMCDEGYDDFCDGYPIVDTGG